MSSLLDAQLENRFTERLLSSDFLPTNFEDGRPILMLLKVEYAKFLALKKTEEDYDATLLSPSPLVDAVWHAHILDTRSYRNANELLHGDYFFDDNFYFIHHDPSGAD